MLDLFQAMAYEQRYKDLLYEARKKNHINGYIIHAEPPSPGSQSLYQLILVYLGRLLMNWGLRMQNRWGGMTGLPSSP